MTPSSSEKHFERMASFNSSLQALEKQQEELVESYRVELEALQQKMQYLENDKQAKTSSIEAEKTEWMKKRMVPEAYVRSLRDEMTDEGTEKNSPDLPAPSNDRLNAEVDATGPRPSAQDPVKRGGFRPPPIGSLEPFATISEDYPTVVRSAQGDCWIEIRCNYCGVNAMKQKASFLIGVKGIVKHMQKHAQTHSESVGRKTGVVVEASRYHTLSDEEAKRIRNGERNAYPVPMIREESDKDVRRSGSLRDGAENCADTPTSYSTTYCAACKSAPMMGALRKRTADEANLGETEDLNTAPLARG